jgi:hypothetical protein
MLLALCLCLVPLAQNPLERSSGDRLELHSGERLDGRVLWADDVRVVARIEGRVREYPRAIVRRLELQIDALATLLGVPLAVGEGRPAQWSDYARFAQSRGLGGEALALQWASLLLDPRHSPAHEWLGHRRAGEEWVRVRADGVEERIADVLSAPPDPRRPWRLSSLHFELRSELALRPTLELYWQLERMEQAWRAGLARELELYEATLPLFVEVYRERRRFPLPRERTERVAWVGLGPTLFIDAEQGLPEAEWTALCLRERIELSFARLEFPCLLPACWSEGLARLASASDWSGPGLAAWPKLELATEAALRLAKSRVRRPIGELLRLTRTELDFQSGFVQRSEECQALVAWALEAEEQSVRRATLVYLGGIARGREGSVRELERAFGLEREQLDARLLQWIRARAGIR